MATITSTTNGNWSAGSTWVGGVVPGSGDTAVIAHNVTVDVNTTIGTSPNSEATAAVTWSAPRTLTVAPGVTFTVKGNLVDAFNLGIFAAGAGSQILFDNSTSGGTPSYGPTVSLALRLVGTAESPVTVTAPSGRLHALFRGRLAYGGTNCNYVNISRMAAVTCSIIDVASAYDFVLANMSFDAGGQLSLTQSGAASTRSITFDNLSFTNSTGSTSVQFQVDGTPTGSGVRRIKGCVFDKAVSYLSKGFSITDNVLLGNWLPNSSSSYNWTLFRNNFVCGDGTANSGNGQVLLGSADRNYFVIENGTGNPHFVSATALVASTDAIIQQCVFESQTPDAIDVGDCVVVNPSAVAGSNKIKVRNCIVAQAKNGESSGCLLTLYNNSTTVTEWERNTANVNNSTLVGSIGRRGMFAFAEASTGGAGQIAVMKGNLAHGTSASQGYLGERVTGNVKDIITAAGCDKNWRYNTSDGDNGRGYEDRAASNTLWTAGDASAAGADANQGSGDPAFVGVTRKSTDWVAARGYGATFADVLTALATSPKARIADLINYVFEGHKPTLSTMRTAAHDGACVGAANYHDSARTLTKSTAATVAATTKYF